ncbi:MAG TPA: class I SAM-dependent methyltransferase [Sphingobacteriaceae bacterium]
MDLSEEMLKKAKAKIASEKVQFTQADITQSWNFPENSFDLITFSLVLEHIEHLDPVFQAVSSSLASGGQVYIGELHPFKQYSGSKARFETDAGQLIVPCFTHHISDFTRSGRNHGLELEFVDEYFDEDRSIPRILTLMFRKTQTNSNFRA